MKKGWEEWEEAKSKNISGDSNLRAIIIKVTYHSYSILNCDKTFYCKQPASKAQMIVIAL